MFLTPSPKYSVEFLVPPPRSHKDHIIGVSLSNIVKLDELGKIINDSVETLQGYFWEFSSIVQVDLNK